MTEMKADKFMYVNTNTFQVTEKGDPDALEFIHFRLNGQSFLYN